MNEIEEECRGWASGDPLAVAYHDQRWCRPEHNERELFAMLCLEGMQAGLSWKTILHKESAIRKAFDDFDVDAVARMGEPDVERILQTPGVIHSALKIRAVISNAQAFKQVQSEFGSFDSYIWGFTGGKAQVHHPLHVSDVPAQNELSQRVAKDLKRRGFKFVGPVIVYSYLQAIGVIDDHLDGCPFKQGSAQ